MLGFALPQFAAAAERLGAAGLWSGGRLTVGLGVGWSPDEYRAAGVPFGDVGEQLDWAERWLASAV